MLEKSFWTLRLFCLYIVEIWFFKILLCLAKSKYREMHEYIEKILNIYIYITRKVMVAGDSKFQEVFFLFI